MEERDTPDLPDDRHPDGGGEEELPAEELLRRFRVDPEQGLSQSEADSRLQEHGPNTIEEKGESAILRFLRLFWGPIPWMLEAAVVLAIIPRRWEDAGVIFGLLLINAGVSFWHERQAQNAIEALKRQLAPKAMVLRDGDEKDIDASGLVPGDIVVLHIGQVVPADAVLLPRQHLNIDESALTGESLPVDKEADDAIYSGTSVKRGEAKVLITATGADTRFARTVELVASAQEVSHFQRAVLRIGYFLIGLTGALVAIVVAVSVARGDPWQQLIMFALVLVIGGIPAALPAVLTVTMTVGANRLAGMKAIVSKLAAMDEMAGLHVLAADKTGTLTKNELTLQDPVLIEADNRKDLILAAALTCRPDTEDPIDNAILAGLDDQSVLRRYDIVDFRPFDPTHKRAEADIRYQGKQFTVAKGAPQVIADLCEHDEQQRREIDEKVRTLGEQGFRALGVGRKTDGEWHYLGLLPLLDPPREGVAEVVKEAKARGIDIRMVTGDHAAIARQVAGQIGLGQEIRTATDIFGEEGAEIDEGKKNAVLGADGFAQVTPEHKFAIIKAFQAGDRIVGMTGDGVNDAPALKQANVGIAVAGATDAARAAADLVLTEPGLHVIINAVEEARRIFERMNSYAMFRIAATLWVVFFISLSVLFFNAYPVTPIMVVLLAVLNDIPIMTIAADHVPVAHKPVRWNMRRVLTVATVLSVAGVVESFLLFVFLRDYWHLPAETQQTMMFLNLLVAGHLTIYITRTQTWFFRQPWPSLLLFVALEVTQILGTLAAAFGNVLIPSIPWVYIGAVWAYGLVLFVANDALKVWTYRILARLGWYQSESTDST